MKKRSIALLLVITLIFGIAIQAMAGYGYNNPGDKNNIIYYKGDYDPASYPQKSLNSAFTTSMISIDGIMDAAYSSAPSSNIENVKELSSLANAAVTSSDRTKGVIRSVWDGPVLYLFVQVNDPTPVISTTPAAGTLISTTPVSVAMTSNPAVPNSRDSVAFGFDLFNEKVVYETDTTAVFTIDSNGGLVFYRSGIPSLSSVYADPTHPEYTNRIKGYSVKQTSIGYDVELALQIEGTELKNGTAYGLDVQLCNTELLKSGSIDRTTNTFWSHNQDTIYSELNHERPNAVDWGNITLTGWNGTSAFAMSKWRLTSNLDYLNSIRFPKYVYTAATQIKLDNAVARAQALITSDSMDKSAIDLAADNLQASIAGLRWVNTKYPDPADLPDQFTLPNPYKFFGSDGKSTRMVTNSTSWQDRRREILDLAQFYEYGYKPGAPDSTIFKGITYKTHTAAGWWDSTYSYYDIETEITYGSVTKSLTYSLYMPSDEQIQASGHKDRIPVVLSFDGKIDQYLSKGIAVVQVPLVTGPTMSFWGMTFINPDTRTNEYAWGTRSGLFYELFPYNRNGAAALNEVSSEMAEAWAASRCIDALEILSSKTTDVNGKVANTLVDPTKLAVTGFSINGKYAFVAAVYDDRIDVCIPGASGATGLSPWRYIYAGQQHDWTNTTWAPSGAAIQVAFGTEFLANSIRHNRVRETELFRHFLTPGNFYKKLEGAYGYGTRLPFDQNDLAATLAGRAIVLENTVNDYNDGCVTDSLTLDLIKTVYENLGYNPEKLLKYNYRTVQPTGDPHGNDAAQRNRSAEYLNYFFYGQSMSTSTDAWLSKNPFTLKISNNKTESPYDYYYGGYNTITGGTGGVNGKDGWYYYTFPTLITVNTDNKPATASTPASAAPAAPSATPAPTASPKPSASPTTIPAASANFTDIGKVVWAKDAIVTLTSKNILKSESPTSYEPAVNITRGDFLYGLVRALGINTKISGNFNDVDKTDYYYNEIAMAKALGITNGSGNNNFAPETEITRQDMMVLTERALKILKLIKQTGTSSDIAKFTDRSEVASYAASSVGTMIREGLIVGSGNQINPTDNTTRAEAAVFLYRIFNKY